jgi:hypothetical protein
VRACSDSALDGQPQRQNVSFGYSSVTTTERSSAFSGSLSSWCSNTNLVKLRTQIHDDFWSNQLSRKMAQRPELANVKKNWEYCFKACGSRRFGSVWSLKLAACLELLHQAPFTVGGEKIFNNTANIMSVSSKYNAFVCPNASLGANADGTFPTLSPASALPGTGVTTCITSTEIYQMMVFNFNRTYAPNADKPTTQLMFESNRNPTPIYQQLQAMYSMHVTGIVTVWVTHREFGKITGTDSPLKALLLYNQNVTLVRIMVETPQLGSFFSKLLPAKLVAMITDPEPCSYYIQKIERALMSWRAVACPAISRATMLPDLKGEIAPYVVNVIDQDYAGWSVGTKKTGILETCTI